MADVLSKGNPFSICQNQSFSISSNRRMNFSIVRLRFCPQKNGFLGKRLDCGDRIGKPIKGNHHAVSLQMTLAFPKAMKWWKKGTQPNMKEIESAQDLNRSLLNAGNKLVIVDFFSPGCGGCRALHPKICQFAEMNPDVLFLQVNYEEHKSMCYSLNVHVLPFFRFYRGANGRVCSFSCTNATIKKFRDALAKHNTERCSLWPAKGLEEAELLDLASNKDLSFTYTREMVEEVPLNQKFPSFQPSKATNESQDKILITARR